MPNDVSTQKEKLLLLITSLSNTTTGDQLELLSNH